MSGEQREEGLRLTRQIGLRTATAVVVGETIAVGIFLTPAGMAKSLGSPLWLLLVWLLMGAMALCGALCYGELAARFPEAGGGYVYLREAYGRPVAFLYGWMAFLVMDPGLTAALAVGMAGYAGYVFGLSPAGLKALAVASILALAAVNVAGVRAGAGLLRWLTGVKLCLLLFVVAWGFASGRGDWANFAPFAGRRPGSMPLGAALASAFVGAFFSFGGWWDLSKLSGEVREPERNLPRALAYGVGVVTLAYVLVSAVFVYLVPLGAVASGETFAAQAGAALFGPAGAGVFSAVVVVAVLGSLAALTMSAPRVYYAMARDRLFFRAAARVSARTGTPAAAIVMQAALASLLVALGTFEEIVAYFVFVAVLFVGLTVAATFPLRRARGGAPAFAAPGYPLTQAVFLTLVTLLLALLAAGSPLQAALGTAVVALGLPVYYVLFRGKVLP
ncbi:MAG TPA: amino acid permease [Pyrinomonadaceae bacterium]|jgi:APA family basic amino acid/polyamine antiporter